MKQTLLQGELSGHFGILVVFKDSFDNAWYIFHVFFQYKIYSI